MNSKKEEINFQTVNTEILIVVCSSILAISVVLLIRDPFTTLVVIKSVSNLQIPINSEILKKIRGGSREKIQKSGFQKETLSSQSENFRILYKVIDYRDPNKVIDYSRNPKTIKKLKRFFSRNEIFSLINLHLTQKNRNIFLESLPNLEASESFQFNKEMRNVVGKNLPIAIQNTAKNHESWAIFLRVYYCQLLGKSLFFRGGKFQNPLFFISKNIKLDPEKEKDFKTNDHISLRVKKKMFVLMVICFLGFLIGLIYFLYSLTRNLKVCENSLKVCDNRLKVANQEKAKLFFYNNQNIKTTIPELQAKVAQQTEKINRLEKTNLTQSESLKALKAKINRICETKKLDNECPKALETLKKGVKKNWRDELLSLPEFKETF